MLQALNAKIKLKLAVISNKIGNRNHAIVSVNTLTLR